MSASDDSTYRVLIALDNKTVSVECFGMYPLDRSLDGTYDSADKLPEWMQSKLAVLNMLPSPPPANDVESVGCRIGPNIFWVYNSI